MATQKPRFTITMPDELEERVTQFWHENCLKNKNTATIRLIEIGLKAVQEGRVVFVEAPDKRSAEADLTDEGVKIAKKYDGLDADYQAAIQATIRTFERQQGLRSADNEAKKDLA